MMSVSNTPKLRFFAYSLPLLIAVAFSAQSLRKGQVIKQFEAYSIAESLTHAPLAILDTTIPCDGTTRWSLEPPVFHELGAAAIGLVPGFPAALPLLAYLLLIAGVFRLTSQFGLGPRDRMLLTWTAALTPAFARFSIQFIPDVLATALLLWAVVFFIEKRPRSATALLVAAVLAKALVFAAVPFILFWYWSDPRGSVSPLSTRTATGRALGFSALIVTPFLGWMLAVRLAGESNVLQSQGLIRNYSLLGWGLLLEPTYYARFITWIVVKGTGLVLAAFAIWGISQGPRDRIDRLLWLWSLGVIPYWILVRQGNRVHDYYSLAFILPLSILGARWCLRSAPRPWLRPLLVALSIGLGIASLAGMSAIPLPPGQSRPIFCGEEMRKLERPAEAQANPR